VFSATADGRRVAVGGARTVDVFSEEGVPRASVEVAEAGSLVGAVRLRPDGRRLLARQLEGPVSAAQVDPVRVLWRARVGRAVVDVALRPEGGEAAAVTPDGVVVLGAEERARPVPGPGNVFGELEGLSTGTRHSFAEAVTDVLVCSLREEDLERLMRAYPEVAVRMVRVLSGRLRELEDLLERLALSSARTRVLHLLVKLADSFGVPEGRFTRLDVAVGHQDLADMVGCSRETVTLTLGELARRGVVRTARRRLWVDPSRARRLLQSAESAARSG
jgi:CRP-like cAMP-binding protein